MTELRGFDLEGETSRAWRAFAGRLADRLADMRDADTLTIGLIGLPTEAPGSGASGLTFTAFGETLVRADLVMETAQAGDDDAGADSDEDDDDDVGDSALEATLVQLGWHAPDDEESDEVLAQPLSPGVIHATQVAARREADQLSSVTVRLLCEVMGAVHPVFLRVSGEPDPLDRSAPAVPTSDGMHFEDPGVTEPADSAELRELVTRTIAVDLGRSPVKDSDGDIVLEVGTARVFVRVLETAPVIQIFGRLVHHVTHPYEAPAVVAELNASYSFIKFIVGGDAVLACVHLPAIPFVPAHLRRMLATFVEIAEHLGEELVRRLGGEREVDVDAAAGDVDDEPEGVPPELLTLLRMDPDGVGLEAEVTAEVCGYDRALAWQLLHIAGGQEAVWRAAARESLSDPSAEARCVEEAAGWQATRRSLANALELINATQH